MSRRRRTPRTRRTRTPDGPGCWRGCPGAESLRAVRPPSPALLTESRRRFHDGGTGASRQRGAGAAQRHVVRASLSPAARRAAPRSDTPRSTGNSPYLPGQLALPRGTTRPTSRGNSRYPAGQLALPPGAARATPRDNSACSAGQLASRPHDSPAREPRLAVARPRLASSGAAGPQAGAASAAGSISAAAAPGSASASASPSVPTKPRPAAADRPSRYPMARSVRG